MLQEDLNRIHSNTIMSTVTIQELIDLNARLVSLMLHEGGRDDPVEEAVRLAVSKLRTFLPSLQLEARLLADLHHPNDNMAPMEIDDNQRQTIQMLPVMCPREGLPGIEQNVFVLFDRVALVSNGCSANDGLLPSDCQFRLAVSVIYNAALFFHKEGLRTGQSVHLVKAVRYYVLALEMLLASVQLREEDLLLELAMANNVGHAHNALANIEEANQCLNYMRQLISESTELLFSSSIEGCDASFLIDLLFVSETDNLALSPAA